MNQKPKLQKLINANKTVDETNKLMYLGRVADKKRAIDLDKDKDRKSTENNLFTPNILEGKRNKHKN